MNDIFVITGSNIGNRKRNLSEAESQIREKIGNIKMSSHIYETEPWGNTRQATFYNQVHEVSTALSAEEVMQTILAIEGDMGRIRTTKNAARIIDIDILFFNKDVISTQFVTVPHKEMTARNFVLQPLCEIAPDFIHPQYHCSVKKLLVQCADQLKAVPLREA